MDTHGENTFMGEGYAWEQEWKIHKGQGNIWERDTLMEEAHTGEGVEK